MQQQQADNVSFRMPLAARLILFACAITSLCSEGKTSWQDLDLDDVDVRLKWAGLFHRRKRTPGRFMMRLKVNIAARKYVLPRQRETGCECP